MATNASFYEVGKNKKTTNNNHQMLKNVGKRVALTGLTAVNPLAGGVARVYNIGYNLAKAIKNNQNSGTNANYQPVNGSKSYYQVPQSNTAAQDAYNAYLNSLGSGGGGGGSITPQRVDLTDILASYEQGAAAQRKTIEDSRESQRQSLLTSLKRFQDETKEARDQQRRAYNASRADLEGQAFMSNRQVAQSAAARGLGGSGLQQLAQLQNQINQSQATDKLAQSNTDVLKQLATAEQSKEEDTNTALQNLDTESANKIAAIEANNAQARANLQYQEAVRYEEARQQAEALAAQLSSSNASSANSYRLAALENAAKQEESENISRASLAAIAKKGVNEINSARKSTTTEGKAKSEAIQSAYDNAYGSLYAALADSGLPINIADTYASQLLQAYNSNYDPKHKYKK